VSHANARLTPAGRLIMVRRIAAGRPVAHVAAEMGVSRTTAWRWWRRFQAEGRPGLVDRPSTARTHPRRTPACVETRVRIVRMLTRRGPLTIARVVGVPASTVGRVLARHHTPRLAECDPVTGQVIRATRRSANRYEHPYPGSLVHAHFAAHGIARIERVITDNAFAYRPGTGFAMAVARLGARQKFIRPHCPWTNGKAERLNRTFATEWAYARVRTSNTERAAALPRWLEHYNMNRPHLGIGGVRPIDRVNNAAGQYT